MTKKIFSLLIVFTTVLSAHAQLNWSRVKVYGSHAQLQQLGSLGLPVDHGEYKYDTYFMTDLSNEDIAKLDQHGFCI